MNKILLDALYKAKHEVEEQLKTTQERRKLPMEEKTSDLTLAVLNCEEHLLTNHLEDIEGIINCYIEAHSK